MRIFYLTTKSELGGAQTHVAQLVAHFKNKGDEVAVMSAPDGWLETETRKMGANFFPNVFLPRYFNPIAVWRAYWETKKAIKLFQPDLVACHSTVGGALGRLAARNQIPTVFTAHGWCFDEGASGLKKMAGILAERWLAHYAKKIICVSQFVAESALRHRVAKKEKLVVALNGIEIPVFETASARSGNRVVEIIFIGRLAAQKDPFTLIKGFALLPANIRQACRLLIIGDGPKKNRLLSYIASQGLGDSVRIAGGLPRAQVFDMLKRADIFVLTTNWEGFPYTVLEAMAHGLPVVATDVGGVKEAVSEDCGFLVKKGDAAGVKDALEKLVVSPELRRRLGDSARQKVARNFTLEKMFAETEKIYDQALNDGKNL